MPSAPPRESKTPKRLGQRIWYSLSSKAVAKFALAVLSLIVATIGLLLYYSEVTKVPEIRLSVTSPSRVIGTTKFNFNDEAEWSEALKLNLGLANRGRAASTSSRFWVAFSPTVHVTLRPTQHWYAQPIGDDVKSFHFEDRTLAIDSATNRNIGVFEIRIPRIQDDQLLAFFRMEGDFKRSAGIIYYSPSHKRYVINQTEDIVAAVDVWNKHVREWNQRKHRDDNQ